MAHREDPSRGIYTQTCHVCGTRGDCRLDGTVVDGRKVWVCTPACEVEAQ